MYCPKCGEENKAKSSFCSSCGLRLEKAQSKKVNLKDASKALISIYSRIGKTKLLVTSGVLLLVGAASALAMIFLPNFTSVEIHAKPLGKFAFDAECQPQNSKTPPSENVSLNLFDSKKKNLGTQVINGEWVKNGKFCDFKATTFVEKEAAFYTLTSTVEDEQLLVIKQQKISPTIKAEASLGKTYKLLGEMMIYNSLSEYDYSGCRNATLFGDKCGSVYWSGILNQCHGDGGFSDLGAGTIVTVSDGTGSVLATGKLLEGKTTFAQLNKDLKKSPKQVNCPMTFEVEGVPSADEYVLEVSHRGKKIYTWDAMKESGFKVSLQIGD